MLLLARVLFIHRLVSATDLFVIEPFLAEIPVFLGSSEEDFDDDGIAFEDDRESSGDDHVGGQENIFDKLMLVPPPPPLFLFNFEVFLKFIYFWLKISAPSIKVPCDMDFVRH